MESCSALKINKRGELCKQILVPNRTHFLLTMCVIKCSKFSVDILRLAKETFGIKSEAEEEKQNYNVTENKYETEIETELSSTKTMDEIE